MSSADVVGKVVGLHVYPIKGCRAIDVQSVLATPKGFLFDRHWVIVKENTLRFVTQRNCFKLAQISCELPVGVLQGVELSEEMHLILYLPCVDQFKKINVPLKPKNPLIKEIQVCEWTGYAMDEGPEVAEALSEFLEMRVRLFRYIHDENLYQNLHPYRPLRNVDPNFAKDQVTTFTDGFPYLIVNQKSYEMLLRRSRSSFPINRFRPNIVIEADNAWEEDEWRKIEIFSQEGQGSGAVFRFVKPCKRCQVTQIDQRTGHTGLQPLTLLKAIRNGQQTGFSVFLKRTEKQGFFGWNAVNEKQKFVSIDDAVALLEKHKWVSEASWRSNVRTAWEWIWRSVP